MVKYRFQNSDPHFGLLKVFSFDPPKCLFLPNLVPKWVTAQCFLGEIHQLELTVQRFHITKKNNKETNKQKNQAAFS